MQKNEMVKKKERPILFSGEMVRAILDGRKTQTRRIVKLPKKAKWGTEYDGQVIFDNDSTFGHEMSVDEMRCQYGAVGDRLWVRETFGIADSISVPTQRHGKVSPDVGCKGKRAINWVAVYRADGEIDDHPEFGKAAWQPSIFMPRWASRILLEITAIRVERLHDITKQDAIAEGIKQIKIMCSRDGEKIAYKSYDLTHERITKNNPIDSYKTLWESINSVQSWLDNPWVWVVEFKRIEVRHDGT